MNTESEAKAILKLVDNNLKAALEIAERQLNTVYTRAQVLLSLAGVVVTVTGFSGRLIAGSSGLAQIFLVAGLFVSLSSAIWVFLNVMPVRWVTVAGQSLLKRRTDRNRRKVVNSSEALCYRDSERFAHFHFDHFDRKRSLQVTQV